MKKVVLLLSALLLTSCVEKVAGTFETKKPVTLRGTNGSITLSEGVHSAVLKVGAKKAVTLVVEANGQKSKVKFNLPKGVRIPTNNGQVRLASVQVGQPYDVVAAADTTVSRSGPRTASESCSVQVVRPVCRYVVTTLPPSCYVDRYGRRICHNPPPVSRRVCTNEWTYVYGYRQVTYEYRGETTEFNFSVLEAGTNTEVAKFNGHDYDSDRVVLNYGPCLIYGTGVVIR